MTDIQGPRSVADRIASALWVPDPWRDPDVEVKAQKVRNELRQTVGTVLRMSDNEDRHHSSLCTWIEHSAAYGDVVELSNLAQMTSRLSNEHLVLIAEAAANEIRSRMIDYRPTRTIVSMVIKCAAEANNARAHDETYVRIRPDLAPGYFPNLLSSEINSDGTAESIQVRTRRFLAAIARRSRMRGDETQVIGQLGEFREDINAEFANDLGIDSADCKETMSVLYGELFLWVCAGRDRKRIWRWGSMESGEKEELILRPVFELPRH